ncbi:MAG: LexA family protein [Candidatus Cryptobacteroides sp.]|nr:translesion error-prone DNA polymerase V autoproteolytic subunit [Bacteroidales bacterium]
MEEERTSDAAQELPKLAESGIHAGFPSPATDYMIRGIDLNVELVRHPEATFFGRVVGDSMIDAGVEEGDILIIDKSLEIREGDMAVCFVDGEFTLKYVYFHNPEQGRPSLEAKKPGSSFNIIGRPEELWLVPANKAYPVIHISEGNDFTIWGIVTYVIKKTR